MTKWLDKNLTILANRRFAGLGLGLGLGLFLTYLPSGNAKHRSDVRGFGVRVFEANGRVPWSQPDFARSAGDSRSERCRRGRLSLVTFFGEAKKVTCSGHRRYQNHRAVRR
jgi:hypothetical protein